MLCGRRWTGTIEVGEGDGGCVALYFFFQAEDGIRDLVRTRGLGDVYKRQILADPKKKIPSINKPRCSVTTETGRSSTPFTTSTTRTVRL